MTKWVYSHLTPWSFRWQAVGIKWNVRLLQDMKRPVSEHMKCPLWDSAVRRGERSEPRRAGPSPRLRQGHRLGPRSAARLGLAVPAMHFQSEVKWLGILKFPARLRGRGRTLKEECIYLHTSKNPRGGQSSDRGPHRGHNNGWLLQRQPMSSQTTALRRALPAVLR